MFDQTPRFFGYGSLVNRATHDYPGAERARLSGWRRVWVHVAARPVAYLSVERAKGAGILGLIADVPGNDWAALDLREHAYAREPVHAELADQQIPVQVYAVPQADRMQPSQKGPLILSYIDVVVQGFLREFGAEGADHFFATTHGWDAPVLDDRANPVYPRHQRLSPAETRIVDQGLALLGVTFIQPGP